MGFGPKPPAGYLPVFSVNTEQEARDLIVASCPMGYDGHYYARELVDEQTLDNLQAFSDRLAKNWATMKRRQGIIQTRA